MNKKIKVFDLIEMFYRKEKMPQRIKVSCYEFEYDEEINAYFNLDKNSNNNSLIQDWLNNASKLNNEVEILEDNTEEIEELKYDVVDENGRGWYKLDTIADKVTELIKSVNAIREKPYEAIQVVLNELDKKDKVMDLMANSLTTDYHDTEWVKEYFYKLAEEILTKKKQSDIM